MNRQVVRAAGLGAIGGAAVGLIESTLWLSRISWWATEMWMLALAMAGYALVGASIALLWSKAPGPGRPARWATVAAGAAGLAYVVGGIHINHAWFPQLHTASTIAFNLVWTAGWAALLFVLRQRPARPVTRSPRSVARWRIIAAGLVIVGVLACLPWGRHRGASPAGAAPSPTEAGRPNVLMIVMDTTRADHLSCYGHPAATTPNIDRLAQEGVLFEQATSTAPWTLPSHGTLFTGLYPSQHGARWSRHQLDGQLTTLAEVLQQEGYQTAGFSNNGWISRALNFDQGFDEFFDFQASWRGGWVAGRMALVQLLDRVPGMKAKKRLRDAGATRTNHAIAQWFARDHDAARPFFIFINYLEPHFEYRPPERFRQRFISPEQEQQRRKLDIEAMRQLAPPVRFEPPMRELLTNLYDGELAYLDSRIGELMDGLRARGLLDNTLVIVTSDHGESIGDHDIFEHQFCIYETLVHVPLVMRYPATLPAGQRVDARASLIDIVPTVLTAAGVPVSAMGIDLPGQDLVGLATSPQERKNPIVVEYEAPLPMLERFHQRRQDVDEHYFTRHFKGLYQGPYKFIESSDGGRELYDLRADPKEATNLAESVPEVAGRMEQDLEQYVESLPMPQRDQVRSMSEDVRQELRSLGYVQ
jgi:arylsulfatase A-like enzyme